MLGLSEELFWLVLSTPKMQRVLQEEQTFLEIPTKPFVIFIILCR